MAAELFELVDRDLDRRLTREAEHDSRLGLFVNRAALSGRTRIARLERLVSHVHANSPGIIVGPVTAVPLGLSLLGSLLHERLSKCSVAR